jgi:glycosyltransferase involved in cell wall biosynthesis
VVPDKNILGLIRALSLIRREHPEICIVWAGRVHDNLYHQLCINELNSLGLSSHWQWAGERLDIEALYQHARLLVLPSFHEGLPNVAAEALASGLPCALSNVADAPRIIDNGRNGALFDPCDVSDIAQAILRLIARQAERQGFVMRNAARVYAERHFGEEAMVSAYLRLL